MENIEIAENIIKIIDSRGVIRYKDVVTGKFVKATGEYAKYLINMHSGGTRKAMTEGVKLINPSIIEHSEKTIINGVNKIVKSDWKAYVLIGAGVTAITVGGVVLYKKQKIKQREKELNMLGFEFDDESGEN